MTQSLTSSGITVTIPALTDSANITAAFTDYHASLAPTVSGKATVTDGSINSNVIPSSTTTGKVTVENASSGVYAPKGRIFVQANAPINPQVGDLWMW